MKIIVFEPDRKGYVKEIENNLEECQKVVGGYIETVKFSTDIIIVCNEEGRLLNLPQNKFGIAGTFFMCAVKNDEFASVPEEKIDLILGFM